MSAPAMVYLVDDDPLVRKAISRLLQSEHYVVQSFSSADEFLAEKRACCPSCLVLDLQLPGLNGLDLQKQLVESGRFLPIIFISGHGNIPTSVRAMKAGAMDFLPKPFQAHELLQAVRQALVKGKEVRDVENRQRKIQMYLQQLTPRESQVLSQVVAGQLNKQIALKLGISEKTVKVHRARVMEKMRVESLAELVRLTQTVRLPTLN